MLPGQIRCSGMRLKREVVEPQPPEPKLPPCIHKDGDGLFVVCMALMILLGGLMGAMLGWEIGHDAAVKQCIDDR